MISGAVLKIPFSSTSTVKKRAIKLSLGKIDNYALFCPNHDCSATFESYHKYEEHLLSDQHTAVEVKTSMDFVRSSYLQKMKSASMLHLSSPENSDVVANNLYISIAYYLLYIENSYFPGYF